MDMLLCRKKRGEDAQDVMMMRYWLMVEEEKEKEEEEGKIVNAMMDGGWMDGLDATMQTKKDKM